MNKNRLIFIKRLYRNTIIIKEYKKQYSIKVINRCDKLKYRLINIIIKLNN